MAVEAVQQEQWKSAQVLCVCGKREREGGREREREGEKERKRERSVYCTYACK